MNNTSSPSGAAHDVASISSELSQWLYLHTSLGKGYIAPFPYDPAWVITAGVPDELTSRMRTAENDFHEHHEESLAKDRMRLDSLEQTAQATKRTGVSPAVSAEIKELKERLARPVFVNYRDWNADKATLLELLSKSKFRAMSFVDELGVRAHGYTINKFLAARLITTDMAILSLSGDKGCDSVLIRSSATGGANMLTVRGRDTPRFNLMTLTSPQAVAKIVGRLKEANPCRGKTVALSHPSGACLAVPADQISRVIAKVYATEDAERRITITMSDAWAPFLNVDPSEVSTSEAALSAMAKSLTNPKTLARSIARALITRKIYLNEGGISGSDGEDRELHMDDQDLATAMQWFDALAPTLLNLKHLESRAGNAAKARESKTEAIPVEELVGAKIQLVQLIKGDDSGMVTTRQAARAPGLTPRIIDSLLSYFPDTFKVLADVRKPGSKRASKRVIVLSADSNKAVGGDAKTWLPGSELDEQLIDKLYREWQQEAYLNFRQMNGRPAITIASLPSTLMGATIAVQKRFWQSTTLLPSGPTPPESLDSSGQPGLELWFRYRPDGEPMCVWSESFLDWKLAAKWKDKDEAAAEMRDDKTNQSMIGKENEQ